MYEVKVLTEFRDLTTKDAMLRKAGTTYEIEDENRVRELLGNNERKIKFVEVIGAKKQCPTIYKDKKIIIFQYYLYFTCSFYTSIDSFICSFSQRINSFINSIYSLLIFYTSILRCLKSFKSSKYH